VIRRAILDAGPIVALIAEADDNHQWMVSVWKELKPPALTCEAALTEACFILGKEGLSSDSIFEYIERNLLKVDLQIQKEASSLRVLMKRYRSVPMSLADASLVRMSELHSNSVIVTFDSDFRVYRRFGNKVLSLAMPD
jgi:predicted nucleic acid-binding protein